MIRSLLAAMALAVVVPAFAADYTDIWYNPDQSGYGYNLVQSNDGVIGADGKTHPFLFVTFFVFGPANEPVWYSAELTWNGTDAFMGPLYKSRGTFFGKPWDPTENKADVAGTATFKPNPANDYQGTLLYVVTDVGSATHPLQRQTLTKNFTGGAYIGFQIGQYDGGGCGMSSNPFYYEDRYELVVADRSNTGGEVVYRFTYGSGLTCTISGKYEQHGLTLLMRNATYKCTDGTDARVNMSEIRATPLGLEGRYASTVKTSCVESATFSGPLLP